jgi:serine/threonine protein kinase
LGPYEILAPKCAGGMGEVDKAIDTKLDREVAIKVLSNDLARDPKDWLASSAKPKCGIAQLPQYRHYLRHLAIARGHRHCHGVGFGPHSSRAIAARHRAELTTITSWWCDYRAQGDSFTAAKPRLWSPAQILAPSGVYNVDVTANGKRLVAFVADDVNGEKTAHAFDVSAELPRRAVAGTRRSGNSVTSR